ncbi:cytosolic sulfotransferase 15-like [Olea europaea var. sylvestris]|uniref:Sulfotransferase n=1 Tax=Olea europaea subsp. europaea TaxID=158383 RepID=A0A8S0R538_OLEEU|nr:cytosolic sulfotransferase 15-like [Olea europaea var. sylvestris]CAA2973578.1 cytosolic sulfotransferase 15-like [Olea europaea subsp. europaea]
MAIVYNIAEASHAEEEIAPEFKEILSSLPTEKGWRTPNLYLFQGFWCQPKEIQAIISVQNHYKAKDSDVIVATIPKSGTTWLKALCFAIVNREKFDYQKNHPLLTSNPHELVLFLEYKLYANNQIPDLSTLPTPRLFATHMPLGALPESVRESDSKVVYLCRNPFDTFVSIWHYLCKIRPESLGPLSLEEAFDMYCRGVIGYGPYWDHMLGYWRESIEKPHKVLFLKYEEMKEDTTLYMKKLAEFLGFPFSLEEEKYGVIEEISKLCSFEHLKELEVNKKGKGAIAHFENKNLFRKGEVGDWVNYFSPSMVERLTNIMEEKLAGSGLSFKLF